MKKGVPQVAKAFVIPITKKSMLERWLSPFCINSINTLRSLSSSSKNESFVNGTNASYVEDMFKAWQRDPTSVHISWDSYFRNDCYVSPPNLSPLQLHTIPLAAFGGTLGGIVPQPELQPETNLKKKDDYLNVHEVIRRYQVEGFKKAELDPLDLDNSGIESFYDENLNEDFAFTEEDLNRDFKLPSSTYIGGDQAYLPLKEILRRLETIYCRNIGVEFMFIKCQDQRDWIRKHFETPQAMSFSLEEKRLILSRLMRATIFEDFLAKKFSSEKRFGLEGCETLVPALKSIIDTSTDLGVESFIMGMPHRGRLNILANVTRKPLDQIFSSFADLEIKNEGSGDVRYHLGTFTKRLHGLSNKMIRLSIMANPSHLEAIDPVVQGKTKAEQFFSKDQEGKGVMSILIHGDAAFCGQGVVYETLNLSLLPNYTTHGTIHIIANNQIGFTTSPSCARSSLSCSDVAHIINAPVFHVNADDPEAVVHVARIAAKWRATFHKDIVIDLVGYRRHGHNEIDEPMFTQPTMYQKIKNHENSLDIYAKKLIDEGSCSREEFQAEVKLYEEICETAFESAKNETYVNYNEWLDSPWSGFFKKEDSLNAFATGVDAETLLHIGKVFSAPPPDNLDFVIHKSLERILATRKLMVENQIADWALGEALAFGSLLKEGIHVRLSGQDVERGTFSHRHHVLHNQLDERKTYNPLQNLDPKQAYYSVSNSPLSEYAVLGFEHGYSLENPNALVLWEAQFGDFCNTAQCIIDQFISSGQAKWLRQSGLVLLLPHGMEGMGPEHSSARLERFLQMSCEDPDNFPHVTEDFAIQQLFQNNWIIANCTTPANYFHILRRQITLPFRRPLILMTPKSLLRHPEAKSPFSDMTEDSEFKRIIPDEGLANENPLDVQKLIFCSGRIYYDLIKARKDKNLENEIAIVRIEQISPFPFDLVQEQADIYEKALIFWVQEEHKNQGCWSYVLPRFHTTFRGNKAVYYIGRPCSASTATGSKVQHNNELKTILEQAISVSSDEFTSIIKMMKIAGLYAKNL